MKAAYKSSRILLELGPGLHEDLSTYAKDIGLPLITTVRLILRRFMDSDEGLYLPPPSRVCTTGQESRPNTPDGEEFLD